MKCASCGANALKRAKVPTAIKVAGSEFVSELPGRRCTKGLVATVEGAAGARYELLVAAELVKRGLRGGDTFRFIRKALGMRAADLARVMNVAAETVSRWETAQREVDWPEFLLLGALVDDKLAGRTTVLSRAEALASPHGARRVRLRFQPA